jgi:hypothetical protein
MMDMKEVKAVTARLNERIPSYSEALDDLALLRDFALAAIPVIEAENAALRLDAERYRWLRNDKRGRSLSVSSLEWTGNAELSDAAVDAAMKEKRK